MKLYVLDTSVIGFIEQAHPTIMRHLFEIPDGDALATTIITVGETFSGWLPVCRRARSSQQRRQAYERMQRSFSFYRGMTCLPFDDVAAKIYDELVAQKIRIGTNDLSIAAITLSVNGVLVTRKIVDFQCVPNLMIEDWTMK